MTSVRFKTYFNPTVSKPTGFVPPDTMAIPTHCLLDNLLNTFNDGCCLHMILISWHMMKLQGLGESCLGYELITSLYKSKLMLISPPGKDHGKLTLKVMMCN